MLTEERGNRLMLPGKTRSLLKDVRTARGFSAAELARDVDVTRQTIYGIEDGSFVPNTSVALRLARVLGVRVEDLFALDQEIESETLEAELLETEAGDAKEGQLVRLCRVKDRLLAAPVHFLPAYLPQTDGIISQKSARRVSVKAGLDLRRDRQQLLLAGCDPALSLLAQALERSGIQVISVPCSSRRALDWLKKGRVHAAGSHLLDAATGDYNVPFINRLFPAGAVRVVTFAVWEQGLVVARGNPKSIRSVADIARKGVTFVNREEGSGSRDLLNKALRKAGIAAAAIVGYKRIATGHLSAAYAVSSGEVDCCIATRSAARCFGLDFIPLASERFDLSFSKDSAELSAAKAVFDLLTHSSFTRKLKAIAGYDTAHTGDVLV